ncbi:hypothetical protein ABH920_006869 [Catenulispora sp. EB89]|uniref:hypothetical protein n=1 Tax=Catenulispora sp. EB89 TaxID=3156257 RepID=UPI00351513C3
MTSSRIGRGAIVTLGAAASMAWAAGAANACDNTPPKPTTPNTHDHHSHDKKPASATPATVCAVGDDDVQYAEVGPDGKSVVGGWHNAMTDRFKGNSPEPVYGYQVRLNPAVGDDCTGTVDVSLASYDTAGPTWDSSGGAQHFVGYSHVTLGKQAPNSPSQTLTVKLPGTPGSKTCFGQIDLYFGTTVYDGGSGPGHGPLPNRDAKPSVIAPTTEELITAWNGPDAGGCVVTPPVTTTTTPSSPVTPPKTTTTPPTTSPSTHPSTPASSTPPAAPKPPTSTSTTPTTPATTTTPGTPTLAHTGANVGEVSLVALAFFGAGGTAMFASRKAKAAGARKH